MESHALRSASILIRATPLNREKSLYFGALTNDKVLQYGALAETIIVCALSKSRVALNLTVWDRMSIIKGIHPETE